jgi:hypothetical protein
MYVAIVDVPEFNAMQFVSSMDALVVSENNANSDISAFILLFLL